MFKSWETEHTVVSLLLNKLIFVYWVLYVPFLLVWCCHLKWETTRNNLYLWNAQLTNMSFVIDLRLILCRLLGKIYLHDFQFECRKVTQTYVSGVSCRPATSRLLLKSVKLSALFSHIDGSRFVTPPLYIWPVSLTKEVKAFILSNAISCSSLSHSNLKRLASLHREREFKLANVFSKNNDRLGPHGRCSAHKWKLSSRLKSATDRFKGMAPTDRYIANSML